MATTHATLAGLDGPVTIRHDTYGAPHIQAISDADGFRGLGWAMASDRLFQMDMNRRTILGTLGELIASPGTLASDRFFRTLGIAQVASDIRKMLPPETAALLEAFVEGINGWIAAHPKRTEAEYQLLKIEEIAPWTCEESLAIIRLIGWQLAGDFDKELFAWRMAAQVGPEVASLLYPDIPSSDARSRMLARWPLSDGDTTLDLAAESPESLGNSDNGTNIWVVDGSRTASGKPILANDPHLNLYAPGVWYEASIHTPGFHVSGFTFAGLPFIAIGQNEHLAWGASNWPADTQDLFIETLDEAGTQYQTAKGAWKPLHIRVETLGRRGFEDEVLRVAQSKRGPLVHIAGRQALSLRWTGLDASDELTCFLQAARSTAVQEFLEALAPFGCPTQNFYVIDRAGQIGGIHAGTVPRRHRGETSFPQLASDKAAKWKGRLSAIEFGPRVGSDTGFLANANNKPVEASSGAPSGCRFTPPLRYGRILKLLGERSDWTPDLMISMQGDTSNGAAIEQLAALRAMLGDSPVIFDDASISADWERMMGWSGVHIEDQKSTLLWHFFTLELTRLLLEPLIGQELWAGFQDQHDPQHLLLMDWLTRGEQSSICEVGGLSPSRHLLHMAFVIAHRDASELCGDDPEAWSWSQLHAMRLQHPLRLPVGPPEGIRMPHPGGRHTINVGNFWPSQGWWCNHGVSLRFIAWVAEGGEIRSKSLLMPGEQGNPTDPHGADQLRLFEQLTLRNRPFHADEIVGLPVEEEIFPKSENSG